MNILVVEDEASLAEALGHILRKAGNTVDVARDGLLALDYLEMAKYELVILDVMLPELDGFGVVRTMRARQDSTPVLMLTARSTVTDKVNGLNAGADDYMTKPFDTEELLARVRAMTRRTGEVVLSRLTFGDLALDLHSGTLSRGADSVQLSRKELDVAKLFFSNPGMTIPKEQIIIRVWGLDSDVTENNVEAYISFLRKKMKYLRSAVTLRNLQRIGYRLEEQSC